MSERELKQLLKLLEKYRRSASAAQFETGDGDHKEPYLSTEGVSVVGLVERWVKNFGADIVGVELK